MLKSKWNAEIDFNLKTLQTLVSICFIGLIEQQLHHFCYLMCMWIWTNVLTFLNLTFSSVRSGYWYIACNVGIKIQFSSVACRVQLFPTPWIVARQASLSITNSQSLLKLMSVKSVMPSNHLILCRPLLFLPSIFPSIRIFSNESVLPIRWPKYWSFSFSITPSNEYSGLISFRMDWLDLLAVQGTLKSLLQQHNSKASILQHSAFFIVQLSHSYMTTGKTHSFD